MCWIYVLQAACEADVEAAELAEACVGMNRRGCNLLAERRKVIT